jgi:hypothetical protein
MLGHFLLGIWSITVTILTTVSPCLKCKNKKLCLVDKLGKYRGSNKHLLYIAKWKSFSYTFMKMISIHEYRGHSSFFPKNKCLNVLFIIFFSLFWLYNSKDFNFHFVYWLNLEKNSPARHQWKYGKCVPLQWKNMYFISSIFLNISLISIIIKYHISTSVKGEVTI